MELKAPILITGCARSGTSLVAGILAACGAEFGDTYPGNEHNPKGYFENKHIREKVIKRYLKEIGVDVKGQHPLPQKVGLPICEYLRNEVIREMNPTDSPWAVKGAKICLMWESWRAAFPKAKWILVRRNKEDIVSSCMKTTFMNKFGDRSGWKSWVATHEERFLTIHCSVKHSTMFWPDMVMRGGHWNYLREMVTWCGLEWNEAKVREFVEPTAWRTFA